jgi:hypothetical protein
MSVRTQSIGAGHAEQGVVDVAAIGAAAFIAVEARRQHARRQGSGNEQRRLAQAFENALAERGTHRAVERQLVIGLGADGEVAGGDPAVFPFGFGEAARACATSSGVSTPGMCSIMAPAFSLAGRRGWKPGPGS